MTTAATDSTEVSIARRAMAERLRALAYLSATTCFPLLTLFELREWPLEVAWAWIAAGPLAWGASLVTARARRGRGRVRVDGDVVLSEAAGASASFPRGDVVEARVEPSLGGYAVELWRRGGVVLRFEAGSVEGAHAWLDAAGFALHLRVSRVVLGASWHRWGFAVGYGLVGIPLVPFVVGTFFGLVGAFTGLDLPGWLVWLTVLPGWALFTAATTARSAPARVDVGTDGVLVRRLLSKRFIPYEHLHSVTVRGDTLALYLGAREVVALTTTSPGDGASAKAAEAVTYALDRWRRARRADDLGLLDRRGRAIDAWRDAVRAMLAPQGAFRGLALDRDVLLRVLEDPTASHERRVGAALALAEADGEARTRVRVAIEGSAHEGLRDALDAAVEGRLDEAAVAKLQVGG